MPKKMFGSGRVPINKAQTVRGNLTLCEHWLFYGWPLVTKQLLSGPAVRIGYGTKTKGFTTVIKRDWFLNECFSTSSITNQSSITGVNP